MVIGVCKVKDQVQSGGFIDYRSFLAFVEYGPVEDALIIVEHDLGESAKNNDSPGEYNIGTSEISDINHCGMTSD